MAARRQLLTSMRGALRDGLVAPEPDFTRIDDVDCREWLTRDCAHAQTLESPLMRGLYDLVFAYENGDTGARASPPGSRCSWR